MTTATTDTTPARQLTSDQQARLGAAAEVLAAEHGYDAAGLAARAGVLEWHLQELLALIRELTTESET